MGFKSLPVFIFLFFIVFFIIPIILGILGGIKGKSNPEKSWPYLRPAAVLTVMPSFLIFRRFRTFMLLFPVAFILYLSGAIIAYKKRRA
jgi:hypothetical protein